MSYYPELIICGAFTPSDIYSPKDNPIGDSTKRCMSENDYISDLDDGIS